MLGIALSLSVSSKEQVAKYSGSGSFTTAEFEVTAPWILDWRVNSEFQGSMAIEISLVDGGTGFHKGLILQTKRPGNGVRLFRESGRYRFRISSTLARWDLKVEELTREEAEQYTPR
ncbi:hypothetical protein BA177_15850 [Woeseia oceani]|uniref:GOLD domain-containing protein n=2 Tax=Woeseia oceani TaxID=1548547 RepID=A0A193LIV9_9GAMM|nr:hypothetical protein BA177_15850 [Woeseia oceani]